MITNTNYFFRAMLTALVAALLLVLLAAQEASGQPDARTSLERGSGISAPTKTANSSELLRKAKKEGTIRVIVGLRADFAPEGRLSNARAADQRQAIADAQAGLRVDLEATRYQTLREFETVPYVALEVSPEALGAAQRSPRVTTIQEDRPEPALLDQSAPLVQAPDMWSTGYRGTGRTIAVLDTGVDSSHSFLAGKVVEEACYSGGSDCANGSTSQTGAGSASPCDYADACDHGTHVSGIAAGKGSNFSGIARDANIMPVQVFSQFTGTDCEDADEDPCALSSPSDMMAGLERVYELRSTHDFSSVNISIGGGQFSSNCDTDPRKAIIDNLRSAGIATVIGSGNDGYTDSLAAPACISSAVSVGSTTTKDQLSPGSNSASFLSLLAPGSGINSSVPGGGFEPKSGTSMAAPHVAGAWALLEGQKPSASVDSILSALQNTGTPVTDTRASDGVTKPRINISDALAELSPLANDHRPHYQVVRGRTVAIGDTNVGATRQSGEPDHLPHDILSNGPHSVWYKWEAPLTGRVRVSTCLSDFDTVLAVYKDNFATPSGLSRVAGDDNACFVPNDSGSQLVFDAIAGKKYRIAVTGYATGEQGEFILSVRYPRPPNDDLVGAQEINGANASVNGTNVAATRQPGEPDHQPQNNGPSGQLGERSVWYTWTASETGQVTLDTCESAIFFDTFIAVYTDGDTFGSLSSVAGDDNSCSSPNNLASQVNFDAIAGTTYKIAVTGFDIDDEGGFTLKLSSP